MRRQATIGPVGSLTEHQLTIRELVADGDSTRRRGWVSDRGSASQVPPHGGYDGASGGGIDVPNFPSKIFEIIYYA